MGLPMATLLARRGVRLCVYDPLKPRAVQYVTQFGAVPACSVEDLGCKLRESIFSSNPELRARGTEARRQQDDAKTRMQASDPLRERRHPFLAMSSEFPHPVALQNEAHPGETNEGATPTLARQSGGERSPFGLVVCMLPTGRHVGEVLFSKHGLLDALDGHACAKNVEAPGTCRALVIDCSTIGPLQAAEVAAGAERRGHHFVDAPVSGGVPAATAGTLTFMVGGSRNDVAIASPLLRLMGSRVVHCGEAVGTGQAFKVCNNLILAASMLGVAEAFRLGEALGVDLKLLNDVVNASSGRCWSAEQYNPAPGIVDGAPASRAYAGGFSVDLIVKDLVLCRDAFEAHPLTCPVTDAALTMFRSMSDKGHGHLDIGCAFRHNT
ncbi:putative 3-hydroxyisobutyrate dehydrogenase [Neospora caninum Liverpool]|uniref:3-hydroxyisobutyrate dehydrogenase n=1 Tax=Neospora caninum (strain Liverpool) TaxID=572307 RepID=F0VIZ7_NEOCL|nr:putative 3-hydroxyisobutyrate dehydrogenase [Neospora caninum Liverpool]CBZ53708.1 putative 3-hydroxyisobutyrate dehydrogenase [Neospora caninum Liverpool]CEL67698.1 TPA: 3-hydroxyisobutyrate dehydrogenase, putative [Neospora caninum Liverpool]|eukprot:XP_003883740.1 putative 3-hydroxyisobutyrate dehydrogenase [Neospora caninum Liverpool]